MPVKVEQLPSPICQLGEGPIWDEESQSLYYVDILGASIHRYDYAAKRTFSATVDGLSPISFIFLVEGRPGEFLLSTGTKLSLISWDGKSTQGKFLKTVARLETENEALQFNDGKVDKQGRLYTGTMLAMGQGDVFDAKVGTLYRYDGIVGGRFHEQKDGIGISNGITWDEETNKMFYIDSSTFDIKQFDVDGKGDLLNEKVLLRFSVHGRNPGFVGDGMTNDTEGNLYVATWGGAMICKINVKTKKIEQEIKLPVSQVTSVAFGGPQLDELYVTTAGTALFDNPQRKWLENERPPNSGSLFRITGLGAKGKGMYKIVLKEKGK
ncbi:regucalcin-like [Toxorhynchites rutilus septentrionalis]|uniref:regucalcin-like n=1 Tax=Toxorhynchites rutilus septentrionalis TaxID=329112 RepID=UPI002478E78D|nr:regucalcin-like [Toxorhynchites rutilus septentrionalis]